MIPSNQEHFKDPTSWNTFYVRLPLEGTTWNFHGAGADGKVRFKSMVDITGTVPEEYRASVSYRLASLYILFSLSDHSMAEAFEGLFDVFSAQLVTRTAAAYEPVPKLERTVRATSTKTLW
jgi:hypothetical protein